MAQPAARGLKKNVSECTCYMLEADMQEKEPKLGHSSQLLDGIYCFLNCLSDLENMLLQIFPK